MKLQRFRSTPLHGSPHARICCVHHETGGESFEFVSAAVTAVYYPVGRGGQYVFSWTS